MAVRRRSRRRWWYTVQLVTVVAWLLELSGALRHGEHVLLSKRSQFNEVGVVPACVRACCLPACVLPVSLVVQNCQPSGAQLCAGTDLPAWCLLYAVLAAADAVDPYLAGMVCLATQCPCTPMSRRVCQSRT
jgi:hypothetical protein|eukprot:COSAG01_NODE_3380_length_6171_cov_10.687582_1_plen_132_part_00